MNDIYISNITCLKKKRYEYPKFLIRQVYYTYKMLRIIYTIKTIKTYYHLRNLETANVYKR